MNLQSTETVQTLATMATGKRLDEKEADELLHKYHGNLLFPAGNLFYIPQVIYLSTNLSNL